MTVYWRRAAAARGRAEMLTLTKTQMEYSRKHNRTLSFDDDLAQPLFKQQRAEWTFPVVPDVPSIFQIDGVAAK